MKFQVPGGQATPAPPVGTSLGKFGINLGQFVQQFNERTKEAGGMPIPVVVQGLQRSHASSSSRRARPPPRC